MMLRCMSMVCLSYGQYMNFRVGLFIASMNYILVVYIV